jgi:hypothetical protein
MPRHGNPEGLAELDASEKFAYNGSAFPRALPGTVLSLDWKFISTNAPAGAGGAITAAFAAWAQQTSLSFVQIASGTQDITIQFDNFSTDPRNLSRTTGHSIELNKNATWSTSDVTPFNAIDVQTIAMAEIGHALGLHNSAYSPTKMYPIVTVSNDRTLYTDDKVAISGLYDTYQVVPGNAYDIAVGANGMVWKIGTNALGNGYQVYRWNGTGWDGSDGGAYRIAVDGNGVPWVRDLSGTIFRKGDNSPFTTGNWQVIPGQLARDIGVGANGSVWIIGLNALGDGWQVYRYNGSGWDGSTGGAAAVTVTPSGVPWVLTNSSKQFYRHTNPDPFSGSWELLPGNSVDVGIGPVTTGAGPDGYVWSVGPTSAGNVSLAVWDEQPGSGSGLAAIAAAKSWVGGVKFGVGCNGCSNMRVAVGPDGVPWVVDDATNIYKPFR